MDAAEFIRIAGRIATIGKAGPRTAISRAYYGLFHIARELVEEFTAERYGSGKSHNLVPQFIESTGNPVATDVARLLKDLHHERIKSDYHYHLSEASVEVIAFAMTCVEKAVRGQQLLEQLRHECLADDKVAQRLKDGVVRIKAIYKV